MAYSAPTTRSTGFLVTAAVWNQDVVDNVTFLANPPACRVYNSANISCANNAETAMTFDTERFDTDSMHSTSVNTGRITITTPGLYVFGFCVVLAADTDYIATYATIRLNGTTPIAQQSMGSFNSAIGPVLNPSGVYKFAAADYFDVVVYQINTSANANNALNGGNRSPEAWAAWIGLG